MYIYLVLKQKSALYASLPYSLYNCLIIVCHIYTYVHIYIYIYVCFVLPCLTLYLKETCICCEISCDKRLWNQDPDELL